MTQINFSGMSQQINSLNNQIQQTSQGDMSNPSNLLKLQNQMMMMQTEYGAMSGIINDIKTVSMSIIQKM